MKRYWAVLAWFAVMHACAAISVRDDAGNLVVLQQPARRIVTLAPHATEMVFAAGGGERIVGTVSYSDYPPAARSIPLIGDTRQIDMEHLIALKPDLLVAWLYGNSESELLSLRKLGIPLFYSEPRKLDDIPATLLRLGQLLDTGEQARRRAENFRAKLAGLAARYRNRSPVRVFYQVWSRPLYTLNGQDMVSDALRFCGGVNIFAGMTAIAPMVSVESVLLANPDVVIAGAMHGEEATAVAHWKSYPALAAVRHGNLFSVDADLLNRPGPRIVDGVAELCAKLDSARNKRNRP